MGVYCAWWTDCPFLRRPGENALYFLLPPLPTLYLYLLHYITLSMYFSVPFKRHAYHTPDERMRIMFNLGFIRYSNMGGVLFYKYTLRYIMHSGPLRSIEQIRNIMRSCCLCCKHANPIRCPRHYSPD